MLILIPVLVNVAFFTLLERKILGLRQSRKGPNKVSFTGLLQPFSDAIKLFLKETVKPLAARKIFLYAPILAITLVLVIWSLVPFRLFTVEPKFTFILLLIFLRLSLYPLLLAGWASNRKYALIGALRGVAQTLSYEVRLAIISARMLTGVFIFSIILVAEKTIETLPLVA